MKNGPQASQLYVVKFWIRNPFLGKSHVICLVSWFAIVELMSHWQHSNNMINRVGTPKGFKLKVGNSGLCVVYPQITFVGESGIGWVTFKEQLGKRVTVNEFQGMVRRSLQRSKIRKLILPFDNRFHLTCQGSHFWNRTLLDWWWGHHKQGHMKKPFVEIDAKSICAGILGSGART